MSRRLSKQIVVATLVLVALFCGTWTKNAHSQPGVTYDVIRHGGLEVRVFRAGELVPSGPDYGVCATLEEPYWSEIERAVEYFSQFVPAGSGASPSNIIEFGFIPNLDANGYGGPRTIDGLPGGMVVLNAMEWDILSHPAVHPIGNPFTSRSAAYKTMVHELCHVFGVISLPHTDGAFMGPLAMAVNHGRGVRLQRGSDGVFDNGHLAMGNGIIDVASWSGDRTFLSEVELAIILDRSPARVQINLKDHFGYSEYRDGQTLTLDGSNNTLTPAGVLFDSNAALGIGLHIVGEYDYATQTATTVSPANEVGNTITLNANIFARGDGGTGIRIENHYNTVTIAGNRTVATNGADGVGILVTRGSGTTLVNYGTVEATGTNGRGVWFNADASTFDNYGTINAGSNDAIYIDRGVTVGNINIHGGAQITGHIVSVPTETTLNFSGGGSIPEITVEGDIRLPSGNVVVGVGASLLMLGTHTITANAVQVAQGGGLGGDVIDLGMLSVVGDLFMDDGSTLLVGLDNGNTSSLVSVSGTADIGAINIDLSKLIAGEYTLLSATGLLDWDGVVTSILVNGGAMSGRVKAEAKQEENKLLLAIVGSSDDGSMPNYVLRWAEDSGSDWNAARWIRQDNNEYDSFFDNDSVIFDLTGSQRHEIKLTEDVFISKDTNRPTGDWKTDERGMRVSGNGYWEFTGGSIHDNYAQVASDTKNPDFLAALVFDGTGTLALLNDNPNAYHDGTVISGNGSTLIVRGVDWLGSTEHVGKPTTGGVVQGSGYGIKFESTGSTIVFQSGTTFDPGTELWEGILKQRIGVEANSTGALRIDSGVIVITADTAYQGYAPNKNGGAVNIAANGRFEAVGQFIFAENESEGHGGAIYMAGDAQLTTNFANFIGNEAQGGDGGAIRGENGAKISASGSAANRARFSTNTAANSGGAISVGSGAEVTANNTDFDGNSALLGYGGAIDAGSNAVLSAQSATFTDNTAVARGGAISTGDSVVLNLDAAAFFDNTLSNASGEGGAIYTGNSATIAASGAKFHGNEAGAAGGAIRVGTGATLTLDNSGFFGNAAVSNAGNGLGGAIFAGSGAAITATNAMFGGPTADSALGNSAEYGGAIYVGRLAEASSLLDVSNSTFDWNTAAQWGGALYLENTTLTGTQASFTDNLAGDYGGAVFAVGPGELELKQSTFERNLAIAGDGGAICVGPNVTLLDVEDSRFIGNEAGARGGAIAVWAGVDAPSTLNAANAAFSGNYAGWSGGALHLFNTSLDTGGTTVSFVDNVALSYNGAELYGWGGAIFYDNVDGSVLNIDNAQFYGNEAGADGGALYTENVTVISAQGAKFIGNHAWGMNSGSRGGGAVTLRADGSKFDATGAEFIGNSALLGGAIRMGADSVLIADGAEFSGNSAGLHGGAIVLFGDLEETSTLSIKETLFERNSGGGHAGAIYTEFTEIDGRGAQFLNNSATLGSGAVATFNSDADWRDATFQENNADQFGGAMILVYAGGGNHWLRFGASEGVTSGFSGNTAEGKSSSIHFLGTENGANVTMTIETAQDGRFELLDGMTVDAENNAIALNIVKQGDGIWTLGDVHDMTNAEDGTTVSINAGRFEMLSGAELRLKNADKQDDAFTLGSTAQMVIAGKNVISTSNIELNGKLNFDLADIKPVSSDIALTIHGLETQSEIGSQKINVTQLSELRGVYNLVQPEGASLVNTGAIYYKGDLVENLDRLVDFWTLNVSASLLQLSIDRSPNTTMTWSNAEKNNLWSQSARNWAGMVDDKLHHQFLDGDDVIFGNDGAGIVKVHLDNVAVGTLLVDSSKGYTFTGGSITGGQFDKYGTSTLTLNNKNVFDTINIHEGTLAGGNGGDWVVQGNLRLHGGTEFRPDGAFRVMEDIAFDAGSFVYLNVGTEQGQSDLIAASGVMAFAQDTDGTVTVVIGNRGAEGGQEISATPILNAAGGITLGGEEIVDGVYGAANRIIVIENNDASLVFASDHSLALQAATVGGGSTNLALDAFGTGFGPLGPTVKDFNQNQMTVYTALENAPYLTTANGLFARLVMLDDVAAQRMFLDSLIPKVNGAAMFAVQRGIAQAGDALLERVKFFNDQPRQYDHLLNTMRGQQRRGFCIDGNPVPWFQQMGDFITQNDTQEVNGYKTCAYGFLLGADKRLSREALVGVGLGGNFATVESGWTQRGKANTFLLTAYGGYTYDDWTVAGNFGYAGSRYLLKRNAGNVWLESEFSGDSFLAGAEVSKKFRFQYVDLTPFASLQLITLSVASYDEDLGGAGAVHIAGQDSTSVLQTLGARFGRTVVGPRGTLWNPSISAGWVHDYGDGDIRSITTYGGATPFALIGAIKHRDRGMIGLNLNVTVKRLSVFGSYDAEMASGYHANTIQSGFTFAF